MTTYKIGTRGSLLAVTQSTLIKNQLTQMTGETFELHTIKTQGDEITNKPLWQLEGKDFFTKELDEALLRGDVDFVIHSYKDLGSIRPEGIRLAAVTERRFAHDILLIHKDTIKSLESFSGDLRVGTSSPRRIANLTHSLSDFIPHRNKNNIKISCEMLRGNVNSRIRKLKEGNYHAITLALAGIERLAHTEKSAAELKELLEGLNYLVLPQSVFPSAASQGALGIEMNASREDGGKLYHILSQLAHARTVEEVIRERKAFKDFGGGCHLAVGIHVKKVGDTFLHVHSGEVDGKRIESKWLEGETLPQLEKGKKLFVGLPQGKEPNIIYDEFVGKVPRENPAPVKNKNVFVTSRYCLGALKASDKNHAGLWAAGTQTAKKLTEAGFWINGTSDSLGTDDLKELKNSLALQMLSPSIKESWTVLSHDEATSDVGDVFGCYSRTEKEVSPAYKEELKNVGAFYWTSFPQYQAFTNTFPFIKEAKHFCGLGKTWQEFNSAKLKIHAVASMQDFYDLAQG